MTAALALPVVLAAAGSGPQLWGQAPLFPDGPAVRSR